MSLIYRRSILLGFSVFVASGCFRSWSISLGVLSGLFLALVNLWLIQRSVGGLLAGERAQSVRYTWLKSR